MRLTVQGHYTDFGFMSLGLNVRFGSQADICAAKSDVRFAPNSDCESGHPQHAMSTLPPKADMCSAMPHVCFGPKADIATTIPPRLPSAQPECYRSR